MYIEDFRKANGKWAMTLGPKGAQVKTRCGTLWISMRGRCNPAGSTQKSHPSYIGVTCGFVDFQDFACWATDQVGCKEGWQLDKDLLVKGNKVYSRDTCIFLPKIVNQFLCKADSIRGDLPVGVIFEADRNMFTAKQSIKGYTTRIGSFSTPEAAFNAYKAHKERSARLLADEWEHALDPRATSALRQYTVDITD